MWNCTSLGTGRNEAHFCNIYYWSSGPDYNYEDGHEDDNYHKGDDLTCL